MTLRSTLSDRAAQVGYAMTPTDHHSVRNATLDVLDHVRSSGRHMRDVLLDSRDGTLRYIRHEPVKTVVLVAAVGVLALGIALLARRRRRQD